MLSTQERQRILGEQPHTPGPCEECHDMDGDYVIFAGKKIIAITDKDSDEEAANARLIAAAPAMLRALEVIASTTGLLASVASKRNDDADLREFCELQKTASDAIRKAKGL